MERTFTVCKHVLPLPYLCQKLKKAGWNQTMNPKFNIHIVVGRERQGDTGVTEARLVSEKKTTANDTRSPLAGRGRQCVTERQ